ncbi:MAG TPA: signal peptidase II [Acidimicrobiales bacterium]|nr:signal peptidase II [Acidimicrobiales bacterium]
MSLPAPARRTASRFIASAAALVVVAIDQLSKSWALASLRDAPIDLVWTLRLRLTFNTGAAFSIGSGFPWLFVGLGVLVLGAMGIVVLRSDMARGPAVGLGMIAGGAVGNLLDRLLRDHHGAVVDFIDLQWWPVFNLADSAIFLGVAVLLLTWRDTSPKKSADAAVQPDTATAPGA